MNAAELCEQDLIARAQAKIPGFRQDGPRLSIRFDPLPDEIAAVELPVVSVLPTAPAHDPTSNNSRPPFRQHQDNLHSKSMIVPAKREPSAVAKPLERKRRAEEGRLARIREEMERCVLRHVSVCVFWASKLVCGSSQFTCVDERSVSDYAFLALLACVFVVDLISSSMKTQYLLPS